MEKAKKPLWKKILNVFLWITLVPVVLLVVIIGLLYYNQGALVQQGLSMANESFKGKLTVKESDIFPFRNFPNMSIDLQHVRIYEDKLSDSKPIVDIDHLFVDFDAMKILKGKYRINTIEANGGSLYIVQDTTGNFNITKAFESTGAEVAPEDTSAFKLNLKKIKLKNIKITKINESNKIKINGKFDEVNASFRIGTKSVTASVDGKFVLTVIKDKDTTFVRDKNFDINASIRYSNKYEMLTINKSVIKLEDVPFGMEGRILMKDDVYMDMKFNGEKSDFNLLFAFLPADLAKYMKRYQSKGLLYFDATIKGMVSRGQQPQILADFGCKNGFFKNSNYNRKLESLAFTGYFTNGAKRNITTFEVGLLDVFALPEQGDVHGNIVVRNFEDPTVNMDVSTDFDLQYLAQFLQLPELKDMSGQVKLKVHYDELVDIAMPKTTFAKLKQGVDSELKIKNLAFKLPKYPHMIKNLNLSAEMKKKALNIEYCTANVGSSDISLKGTISNLPDLLHLTKKQVDVVISLASKNLNLKELTTFDTTKMQPIDEQLTNFNTTIRIHTSAKRILDTTTKIPLGDFAINNFNVKLQHYKHPLTNFNIVVYVDSNKVTLQQFSGQVNKTDLNLTGSFKNYAIWFNDVTKGTSELEYKLVSGTMGLRNLFKYKGVNYVPEDLQRERIKGLTLEGNAKITYDKEFKSMEIKLVNAEGQLRMHPLKLEQINGEIKYSDNRIRLKKLTGKMGDNDFSISLAYFLGNIEEAKKDNRFTLRSKHLNLNEILNFNEVKRSRRDSLKMADATQHDSVFNVFSLPFSNMKIKLEIGELIYKELEIKKIKARMRMQKNHMFIIDTLGMDIADGHIDMDSSFFDGSNKEKIFFKPRVVFKKVDLSKLFLKFDNFGQTYLVSDNITGILTGKLTGKIRMHADMIPIIETSRIKLKSIVTNGSLNNYGPMSLLADYFKDKNLKYVRFDTLVNTFSLKKGVLEIPNMRINSSLGFIEFEGKQAITTEKMEMDYQVKVPMKMVTDVGFKYLFNRKKEEVDSMQVDDIIVRDENKKMKFINVNIKGNTDDFKISLKKK
ncbi:MAG: hypothetical protein K0S33_834 [Bacteroidetes bacterium]|jgi:hypothetical protein|nr:hypothetical protein [Bacteroidota bacterium]